MQSKDLEKLFENYNPSNPFANRSDKTIDFLWNKFHDQREASELLYPKSYENLGFPKEAMRYNYNTSPKDLTKMAIQEPDQMINNKIVSERQQIS